MSQRIDLTAEYQQLFIIIDDDSPAQQPLTWQSGDANNPITIDDEELFQESEAYTSIEDELISQKSEPLSSKDASSSQESVPFTFDEDETISQDSASVSFEVAPDSQENDSLSSRNDPQLVLPFTFQSTQTRSDQRSQNLKNRKCAILMNTPVHTYQQMQMKVARKTKGTDCIDAKQCWLKNSPTRSEIIANRVCVRIPGGEGSWDMHFGIASMLIHDLLTEKQKHGIIHKQWELSHLCGNWRCLNHNHYTLEDNATNKSRNRCFNQRHCTKHHPRCMVKAAQRETLDKHLTQCVMVSAQIEVEEGWARLVD